MTRRSICSLLAGLPFVQRWAQAALPQTSKVPTVIGTTIGKDQITAGTIYADVELGAIYWARTGQPFKWHLPLSIKQNCQIPE